MGKDNFLTGSLSLGSSELAPSSLSCPFLSLVRRSSSGTPRAQPRLTSAGSSGHLF